MHYNVYLIKHINIVYTYVRIYIYIYISTCVCVHIKVKFYLKNLIFLFFYVKINKIKKVTKPVGILVYS